MRRVFLPCRACWQGCGWSWSSRSLVPSNHESRVKPARSSWSCWRCLACVVADAPPSSPSLRNEDPGGFDAFPLPRLAAEPLSVVVHDSMWPSCPRPKLGSPNSVLYCCKARRHPPRPWSAVLWFSAWKRVSHQSGSPRRGAVLLVLLPMRRRETE